MTVCRADRLLGAALLAGAVFFSAAAGAVPGDPVQLVPRPLVPPEASGQPSPLEFEPGPMRGAVPNGMQVEELQPPDPSAAGTLHEGKGGFGADMWSGTRLTVALKVLPLLPAQSESRAVRNLMRRLLLTAAALPEGKGGPSLLDARAERLWAMGETGDLVELLRAAAVKEPSANLRRLRVDALLLEPDPAVACAEAGAALKDSADAYAMRAQVFCLILAGKANEAALALELLREKGDGDRLFTEAAEALLGHGTAQIKSLKDARPLHLAMLRAAKQPLPADAAQLEPALLKGVAVNEGVPLDQRLAVAERAERIGALDTQALRVLYESVTFGDAELKASLDSARGPRAHALLYRAARQEGGAAARAEIIAKAFNIATEAGEFTAAGRLHAPLLAEMKPAPELAWFARHAVRGLLAAGQPDAARPWVALAVAQSANPDAADALVKLAPLLRLAEIDDGKVPLHSLEPWRKAQGQLPAPRMEQRSAVLYGALAALGEPVAGEDWAELIAAPPLKTAEIARPGLWHGLRVAAEDLRLAETVALGLASLGDKPLARVEPSTLYRVIAALRLVGLDAEARQLAVEAAIANGV